MKSVACISVSPVKGFRLHHPEQVELGIDGVAGNRRFFIVDAAGERLRGSITPWYSLVYAAHEDESLRMRFPGGLEVEGSAVAAGEPIHTTAGTLDLRGRVVDGPWTEPLSQLAGAPVRLVRADDGQETAAAPLSLVSDGSLARFAAEAGETVVDSRRFRMLFELAGCNPHEEDEWEGERLQIGDAVVRVGGPITRCAVTTRDPDTAERDVDTLRVLADYRGRRASDGAVLFGVYAYVELPGTVRVGDGVTLVHRSAATLSRP